MSETGHTPLGVAGATGATRRARLEAARLFLVLEAEPHGRSGVEIVRQALAGGVDMVQLREKDADDDSLLVAAAGFRAACDEHDALLILNDRLDLVLESGADGVHLGQDDSSVEAARALLGADVLVGVSTHTPDEIAAARDSLADYFAVGPVHATPTKPKAAPVGHGLVRQAAKRSERPFFAIGGIDARNAPAVVAAGARRIAVVRAIRDAEDPRAAAAKLRSAVDSNVTDDPPPR